ncbi:hypothetical protein DHYCH-1000022 [Large yellow croaker iridovirus]|nr:hypothetical protein DHYCH-1000022 [Large yellow croaker iridovirus]UZN72093.1 hypothetical protein DHYCH-2000006 [Large yellow croaker iridovirus]UZN72202.1 hypothetical protein XHYCH-1000006 [Large yellow croaker iridovirus]
MDCPVCLVAMSEPYVLNCGHSVCKACCDKLGPTCCVCRTVITSRATNYALRTMLESCAPHDHVMCGQHAMPNYYTCVTCGDVPVCLMCTLQQHWSHQVVKA